MIKNVCDVFCDVLYASKIKVNEKKSQIGRGECSGKKYVCGSKEIGVPNLSSARSLCADIIEKRARKSELLIGSNICSGNRLPSLCRIPLELTFIIWLLRRLVR